MLQDFKNTIDFFIRNKTKFSRKNFIEKNPELIKRNEKENLYTKDILNQFFKKQEKKNLKILDIGSKNWFYAKGEYDFFNDFCKNFELHGVEIDAYRLYSNFYNRLEVAKFHTKNLKNTKYFPDNLLNIKENYDYIIWFLPFISIKPHVLWGLPKKIFKPEKMFLHAYQLLNKNGQMLIINQGEKEAEIQKELLKKLNIPYQYLGEIKSNFFEYQNKRFGYLIE